MGDPRRAGSVPTIRLQTEVLDLRRAGHIFDDVSANWCATATALLNWHDNARFSAVDGAPTKPIKGGWARVNAANGHEEFPAHRPGDDLPGARRARPRGAGPPDGVARADVLAAGRIRRGGRVVRSLRRPRDPPRKSA